MAKPKTYVILLFRKDVVIQILMNNRSALSIPIQAHNETN